MTARARRRVTGSRVELELSWPQASWLGSILREIRDDEWRDGLTGEPAFYLSEKALALRILAKIEAAEVELLGARGQALIEVSPHRRLPERAASHAG